jgi:GTPase SAR1 family protein
VVQSSSNFPRGVSSVIPSCPALLPAEDTTAQEENAQDEKRVSEEKYFEEFFKQAVAESGIPFNSSRLCLVGQGRAGKTALANALINKEFKHTDSTMGVSQSFLEVTKRDVVAAGRGQWNMLGEDKSFIMSQEDALVTVLCTAQIKEESTNSVPQLTRQDTSKDKMIDFFTGEERNDDDENNRELEPVSCEGGQDVSVQDVIETNNTAAAVGGIQFDLSESYQSESPGKTPQKKCCPPKVDKERLFGKYGDQIAFSRGGGKEPLRISLWDYGGQDKFNGMHHLYLSRYCVYLLVFDMQWLLPLGLKWKDAGSKKPSTGAEIKNELLAAALQEKDEFTKEEWEIFLLAAPSSDSYIKAGERYFVLPEKGRCLEYLKGWMDSILMHAVDRKDRSQAPILIIGSHKDKVQNPENHADISKIIEERFKKHRAWTSVQQFKKGGLSFFPVDNKRGQEDDVLQQMQITVEEVLEREKYVKSKVPFTWLGAYEDLQKETNSFLEFEKVKDICSVRGMGMPEDLELNLETVGMLKFFHEMGLIMYHDEEALKDLVILNPARFLVEPASCVVCQLDVERSDDFSPDDERIRLITSLESEKPHQYEDLRKGVLHRQILWDFLWKHVADNKEELEVLMTKYQLMVPLANKDGNEDRFLVPGLLPDRQTNQVDDHRARLVGYFIFGHMEIIQGYRKEDRGYVSVDEVKREGFLPKGLFAAVLGSIVQECEVSHSMSFKDDMEMTLSSISTGFGRHKFVLRQLPEHNMMELILMVDSPLLIVERLLELMQGAVSKLMPTLRFAICIDQEGGVCRDGQVPTPKGTDSLVILDSHETVKNDDGKRIVQRLDGKNSLEQRVGAKKDIKVAKGHHCLNAPEARRKFCQWLIPSGLRESSAYHVFLSYRWGNFDCELVTALFSKLCTEVIGDGKQVHVFLDRHRLEKGRKFSSDFARSLINSLVVVPVVSYAALARMLVLKPDSNIDNVLLEWMLIVELRRRGHLKFCYPIIAGEVKENAEDGKFILDLFAVPALGLKWKEVGFEKPSSGTEIKNELLAATLQNQVEFKKEEWEKFQVKLSSSSYIKAGEHYFQPAIYTPCIDKLPEVVCTQVARRVDQLLKENGMDPVPSEFVNTYTVRGVVKELVEYNGLLAWEANALPMEQQQSKQHVQIDWKKGLYKLAADGVLQLVEEAAEQARQKEEEEAAAARAREQEAARRDREEEDAARRNREEEKARVRAREEEEARQKAEADQKAAEQARQKEEEEAAAARAREQEAARRDREEDAARRNREEEEVRVRAREEEEARQKAEADQKAAEQAAGKRLLPL